MLKLIFIDMFLNKLLLSQIEKNQSFTFNKKSVTIFNAQTHGYGEHMLTRLKFY